jgi:hypothetical protein
MVLNHGPLRGFRRRRCGGPCASFLVWGPAVLGGPPDSGRNNYRTTQSTRGTEPPLNQQAPHWANH